MNALWKQCQTKKSPFKLERVIFSKFLVLSFLLQDPWSLYCPFCCSTMIGLKVLFLRKYFSSCIPLSFRKIYYFWNRHLSMKIVIQKGVMRPFIWYPCLLYLDMTIFWEKCKKPTKIDFWNFQTRFAAWWLKMATWSCEPFL